MQAARRDVMQGSLPVLCLEISTGRVGRKTPNYFPNCSQNSWRAWNSGDRRRRTAAKPFELVFCFFFRRRKFVTTACRMVSFLAHADEEGLRLLKNLVTAIVESLPKVTPRCGPRKNVSLRLLFLLRMPVRLPLPFVQRLTWGNRAENKTGLKSLNSRAVSRNECPALITLRRFRPLV